MSLPFIKYAPNKDSYYYFVRPGQFETVQPNGITFAVANLISFYAMYIMFAESAWYTWMFTVAMGNLIGLGVTAGAHRLWSHKSYDARMPLRIFLMLVQTLSGQNCIYQWCREHRLHHKYSETDADPHNTERGFFFAHVGWLLRRRHPELLVKAKQLDYSDLLDDPVVKFQQDYYWPLWITFSLVLPVSIPIYFWQETFRRAILLTFLLRYVLMLHSTWFVNSAAHMFGEKPYNGKIAPVDNKHIAFIAYGEGYHNYHHQFPFDYQASEMGHGFNPTKHFIDFMAKIGQAYNLRTTSNTVVNACKEKTLYASSAKLRSL